MNKLVETFVYHAAITAAATGLFCAAVAVATAPAKAATHEDFANDYAALVPAAQQDSPHDYFTFKLYSANAAHCEGAGYHYSGEPWNYWDGLAEYVWQAGNMSDDERKAVSKRVEDMVYSEMVRVINKTFSTNDCSKFAIPSTF